MQGVPAAVVEAAYQPIAFEGRSAREVLARPGILEDISGAYDSPEKTVDGWMALIPRLTWLEGAQVTSFAGSGPLVTDDRPLPEYLLFRRTFGEKSPLVSPQSLASAGFLFR